MVVHGSSEERRRGGVFPERMTSQAAKDHPGRRGETMRRYTALFSVVLLMLLLIPGFSHSLTLPFRGKGVWIQKNSMNNPLIFSDAFSWYITEAMNEPFVDKLKGPLVMAFSGKKVAALEELIDKNRKKIVAVVWDYEFGASQSQAESDLTTAHKYANDRGLPFGVVVLANPDTSLKANGVSFSRAKDYADFLMPMLYCQWWNCDQPGKTQQAFGKAKALTDLPLIVLITLKTTQTRAPGKLAPRHIASNYGNLNPYAFAIWNVEDLDESYLGAIKQLK